MIVEFMQKGHFLDASRSVEIISELCNIEGNSPDQNLPSFSLWVSDMVHTFCDCLSILIRNKTVKTSVF